MISYTSEGERISAQEILKNGKKGEFWGIIIEAINDSIKILQERSKDSEFKKLPADEYKLENEIINAKIDFLEKLKEMPDSVIEWLNEPESQNFDIDPYERPDEQ